MEEIEQITLFDGNLYVQLFMEKNVKYITHMHNTWWKTWGYSLDWLAGGLPLAKVLPMQAVHDTWHMTAEKSSQRCLWYVNDIGTVFIFWDLFQHIFFWKYEYHFSCFFLLKDIGPPLPQTDFWSRIYNNFSRGQYFFGLWNPGVKKSILFVFFKRSLANRLGSSQTFCLSQCVALF